MAYPLSAIAARIRRIQSMQRPRQAQREMRGVKIGRFNFRNNSLQALKMGKFSRMRFTKRHVGIVQSLEGKDDILSVEVARGLEPRRGMEFHAAPQVECDYPSIF